MANFISTIPVETNRVDLDPDVKDPSHWFEGKHHYTDKQGATFHMGRFAGL